ncbi:hypothetical protein [Luteolibacter soli]|uniref:AraC family transcriptional regulator n=1 Tax=Luteolibacter soli TaxID=3135280 RepID=A0ABU9AZS0_9BACT
MKVPAIQLPFCGTRRLAYWPRDIPESERTLWRPGGKDFSALWRIPGGVYVESLRVALQRRFLVLVLHQGTLSLWDGAHGYRLVEGNGVAISTREFHVEVPCNPFGDTVVELHLFRRIPALTGLPELLRRGVEAMRKGIAGIFPYGEARGLLHRLPGDEEAMTTERLIGRLSGWGIESTVRFVRSGMEEV